MGYGGYHPYPRRFGGAGGSHLEAIHNSLNAQRGTALEASDSTTVVWLENMAFARALCFDGWGTNQRLAHQADPKRTTDMLPRWERALKIVVPRKTPDAARRRTLLERWQRFDEAATNARLVTLLTEELGSYFVALEYTGLSAATVRVPVYDPSIHGPGPWPFGVESGNLWSSTVARLLILLTLPDGATEADFLAQAGRVFTLLDPLVPAWVSFDWYRAPEIGAPIAVANGPSSAGFYLDERNLNYSVFDV